MNTREKGMKQDPQQTIDRLCRPTSMVGTSLVDKEISHLTYFFMVDHLILIAYICQSILFFWPTYFSRPTTITKLVFHKKYNYQAGIGKFLPTDRKPPKFIITDRLTISKKLHNYRPKIGP